MSGAADSTADLLRRLDRLESVNAIRRLVMTYFELCDRLDASTSLASIGDLFTADASWSGRGSRYGAAFGSHEGRDAIVAMLARYATHPPHFALNAHFLGSEHIVVDGNRGHGRWMMLQTSSYTAGGSDLRAANLEIGFERLAEGWRISRFETENIFSRQVGAWNDQMPIAVPEE